MRAYLIRRLAHMVIVLLGVSILVFGLLKLMPGDISYIILGIEQDVNPEVLQAIRHQFALDQPLPVQYFAFLKNLFTGELQSAFLKQPVIKVIVERFPKTAELALLSFAWAVVFSIPIGVISVLKKNTVIDYIATSFAIVGYCVPTFWSALLMMLVFGVSLRWLPISGRGDTYLGISILTADGWRHIIIPAVSLGLVQMCMLMRLTRSSMLEVIRKDFVNTARAKGLRERTVIWKHALRNASLPIWTNLGIIVSELLAGAVLVETVTAWPGVGRLMYQALMRRDEPLVFGLTIFLAGIFVLSNLVVDVIYVFVDPRVTYE